MRKYFIYLISGIMAMSACDFSTKNHTKEVNLNLTALEKELAESDNDFTFKLVKQIDEMEDGNIFVSPLSISFAFGMVYNGASGDTKAQIAELLSMSDFSSEDINDYYKKMIEFLPKLDDKVKFKIGNSIWIKEEFPVEEEFKNMNRNYFNAEIDYLNFYDAKSIGIINDWVNDATNGKIKTILDEIPDGVIMYLINALYFKGDWTSQFKKSNTYDDNFYGKNGQSSVIRMMLQTDKFNYVEDSQMQMIDLPYGDEKFSMSIILPKDETDIDEYLQNLDSDKWNNQIKMCSEHEVEIYLPKFEMECKYDLIPALQKLGLSDAFDPIKADFTAMSNEYGRNLVISEVKHKTYLKVDEEGSEAAAVTSVGMKVTSAGPGDTVIMKVDHPFIFAIREKEEGTILFMGKIESFE